MMVMVDDGGDGGCGGWWFVIADKCGHLSEAAPTAVSYDYTSHIQIASNHPPPGQDITGNEYQISRVTITAARKEVRNLSSEI